MSNPSTVVAPSTMHDRRIRTARTTGLFYLALGITGGFGFLLVRPALFAPGAPPRRWPTCPARRLARIGIALEMGLVVTQAFAALWFYRLFRPVDDFAAGSIAVFGLVNAIAVLVSSAMLATALQVALHPIGAVGDAQLMYLVSSNLWSSGNLFFGLWLIPMGWCVLRSRGCRSARLDSDRRRCGRTSSRRSWHRSRLMPASSPACCQYSPPWVSSG